MSVSAVVGKARAAVTRLRGAIDERDVIVCVGVAFATYGGNVIYPGAGWLVGGLGLYWLGVRGT